MPKQVIPLTDVLIKNLKPKDKPIHTSIKFCRRQ